MDLKKWQITLPTYASPTKSRCDNHFDDKKTAIASKSSAEQDYLILDTEVGSRYLSMYT